MNDLMGTDPRKIAFVVGIIIVTLYVMMQSNQVREMLGLPDKPE